MGLDEHEVCSATRPIRFRYKRPVRGLRWMSSYAANAFDRVVTVQARD